MSADPSFFPGALRKGHGNGHHPNSRETLLRYHRTYWGQRKCHKCARIALRGKPYCPAHGGKDGVDHPSPARLDARHVDLLRKYGLLPQDLIQTQLWQSLAGLGMATRAPLQRVLVIHWDKRMSEPEAFGQVWRQALKAVKSNGGAR